MASQQSDNSVEAVMARMRIHKELLRSRRYRPVDCPDFPVSDLYVDRRWANNVDEFTIVLKKPIPKDE